MIVLGCIAYITYMHLCMHAFICNQTFIYDSVRQYSLQNIPTYTHTHTHTYVKENDYYGSYIYIRLLIMEYFYIHYPI